MFREKHYHMTLSNKAPPRTFSKTSSNFFGTAISQKKLTERLHLRKLYLFSYANNFCCVRVVQGQVSKFTCPKHW